MGSGECLFFNTVVRRPRKALRIAVRAPPADARKMTKEFFRVSPIPRMEHLGTSTMKTWKFVAEILWLFLGLRLCPQSTDYTHDIKRSDHPSMTGEQDNVMERWYFSAPIRPPPLRPRDNQDNTTI